MGWEERQMAQTRPTVDDDSPQIPSYICIEDEGHQARDQSGAFHDSHEGGDHDNIERSHDNDASENVVRLQPESGDIGEIEMIPPW